MRHSAARKTEHFTYADYLSWPDKERWEIIGGQAYNMSPAPIPLHQRVSGKIFFLLESKLKKKKCTPFYSPIDVVLSDEDIVQPDILVICDPKKIGDKNIKGTPDIVFEILSPATSLKDKREKKQLYEKFGVKEYFIVDPEGNTVEQFILENKKYLPSKVFGFDNHLTIQTLDSLKLKLSSIFEAPSKKTHPLKMIHGGKK